MALRVFVVEDDCVTQTWLDQFLTAHVGATVVGCAETELDAKRWLDEHPHAWDLAIVDIFLKAGTGAGVTRHCRSRAVNQSVIVITSHPIESLVKHCLALGADAVYEKTTQTQQLLEHCQRLAASLPDPS
ncbi:MAG: response regulator receiver protein [Polaromonas sp.]|nr:response regulator receiver protein [Polaromonas sp.]